MGNSEVGHTNIGAGRVVYQDLTRITKSIADGEFAETAALVEAIDSAVKAEESCTHHGSYVSWWCSLSRRSHLRSG